MSLATFAITRTILGPLTTTFNPAPDCSNYYATNVEETSSINTFTRGITCATTAPYTGTDPQCLPSDLAQTTTAGISTLSLFSPGLFCPQGWTNVLSATRWSSVTTEGTHGGFQGDGLELLATLLQPGESMQVCCPVGFTGTVAAKSLNDDLAPTPECLQLIEVGHSYSGTSYTGSDCNTVTQTGFLSGEAIVYQSAVNLLLGPKDIENLPENYNQGHPCGGSGGGGSGGGSGNGYGTGYGASYEDEVYEDQVCPNSSVAAISTQAVTQTALQTGTGATSSSSLQQTVLAALLTMAYFSLTSL